MLSFGVTSLYMGSSLSRIQVIINDHDFPRLPRPDGINCIFMLYLLNQFTTDLPVYHVKGLGHDTTVEW